MACCIVVFGVFIVGFGQNLLGTQQMRLDTLGQQLTYSKQLNEELLLERAQLAAPARILQLAQHQLKMVTPGSVVYLTPAPSGPTVGRHASEAPRARK